jgi:hypothetical protein
MLSHLTCTGYLSQESAYIWLTEWENTCIGVEIAIIATRVTKRDV